ncbi:MULTISPECIES: serine/threonine-protein kinase [Streptomyces]|uniref:non-specific serine/threonine protein kinase n=1 Tax=Streptomyces chartreusis NRRL 3882 TaxID=1079985 RepID=A0A2N9BJ81_STRCX|nr:MULTISPECIES: serine/threonine-protein kinase [Streptomyces]MYS95074.1 protein kinase [Streptomyces sp. SID5464]SOR83432.1 Serine/threonine-protein kinase PrkC [Streptomyces chartreusis NRRL 3882]
MSSGSPRSGAGRIIAGRYLLLRRLGSGGMGHVWLAHDQKLACEVALKEIVFRDPAEAGNEREARVARARAEARHAAGLRGHPHVVTVHDVLEHEGLPWIVMEYVAGAVDLRELVTRRGPLAPAECARVGLAVLDALTAGHERGVMHRDVKPANILLAPDRAGSPYGRVLLTDYGISVQPDGGETRYTRASVLVGTAGYLAPERASGGTPTPAADLFSLGCTLYFGVEGRGPFERESHLAALTAAVMEEPLAPVRAGALEPVLHGLLAKDPELRMTAQEAEAALSGLVTPHVEAFERTRTDPGSPSPWETPPAPTAGPDGSGPVTATPGVTAPGARRRRRSPALRAVAACGLGLVLALGGVWYALADRAGGGTARPYGEAVGLGKPLADGDCVLADWPGGTRFAGTPRLSLDPTCRDQAPDGQVVAFAEAASPDEARKLGPVRCEELTRELRDRLADVRSHAVVPSGAGFEAAGRRTACLVLGAHGPLYGPLGERRRFGTPFADTATMQKRDCLDVRSNREARLVPCGGRYDQQVLGFTRLGADVTLAEARTSSDAACAREVAPRDYGFDPSVYEAGSWTSDGPWKSGTHVVVCTVRRQNGGTMEGTEP